MLEHDHDPESIRQRLQHPPRINYLRDWVYGGIDGAITTFAVVSGVAGASLPASIILILGLANLGADGFSMAAGNFISTKAERDHYFRLRAVEAEHIDTNPAGEIEEMRQILGKQGFSGTALESAIKTVITDRERWIDAMMAGEYGMVKNQRSPWQAGLSTLSAFVICGSVPLLPYVASVRAEDAFLAASCLTMIVFFGIGSLKSRWSLSPWWRSGLETLLLGGGAAGVAFAIGYLLRGIA
jgi:VIT1/CCC1 family predicted Fe2+/Mn2+ transporter